MPHGAGAPATAVVRLAAADEYETTLILPWVKVASRTMKIIAALLLTIAVALFPLSGDRAFASLASHGPALIHNHADGMGEVHSGEHAQAHLHGDHGSPAKISATANDTGAGSANPCGGHGDLLACCSLACHAMATHAAVGVAALARVTSFVRLLAMPLPRGSRFDGLLRPPRPA